MSDIMYHLPAVALRGTTILPDMIVHFDVSREKSIQAIEQAMVQDQRILLITQKILRQKNRFRRIYIQLEQLQKLNNW